MMHETVLLVAQFGVKCSSFLWVASIGREELEHRNHYRSKNVEVVGNMNIFVASSENGCSACAILVPCRREEERAW